MAVQSDNATESYFQDRGLGARLFLQATRYAQEELAPCRSCFTWCVDDAASRAFYAKKCGGVVVGLKLDTGMHLYTYLNIWLARIFIDTLCP